MLVKMSSKMSDNFARICNILKKLKQFLKKFCVDFMPVKWGQALIKILPLFE